VGQFNLALRSSFDVDQIYWEVLYKEGLGEAMLDTAILALTFITGIATAEVLLGIRKEPPVRTNVSGAHHEAILLGSRIAVVEELD
jgi:hypothetical protein